MVAVGHAGQSGHRLTLGAGRGDDDLLQRPDLILGYDLTGSEGEVAEVGGDPEVLLHRAAYDGDFSIEFGRGVDDLLDAVDVAGEGGDDDPAFERLHDLAEGFPHGPFGERVAGVLGSGRVGQQADHAVLTQSGQDREIGAAAVDRSVVELEVARGDDSSDRRVERHAHRVGDRVADPEGLDTERPNLERIARIERQKRIGVELVLPDLDPQQAASQRRGIYRDVGEVRQDVRQAADMVLVGVRYEKRPDLLAVLPQVRDVGDHQVDPEHLLVREH